MIETLTFPFVFPFMQNAFYIALMLSVPAGLLSCFLVLKGWALMGDAVSHAVLPGIVLAWIAGIPLIIGAFLAGMLTTISTGWLAGNSRVRQDTVMGVVFSGMFGLGIVLHTALGSGLHLDHILFGNILGIGPEDLQTSLLIAVPVTAFLVMKWKDLMLQAFDTVQAKASGLRTGLLHYGLLTALSLMVVATLSSTGLILAIGLLIAPGAIAFLLVRSFGRMLILASLASLVAMCGGIYLSFFLDSAPGPTIILVLTVMFLLAFVWRRFQIARMTAQP